MLHLSMHVVNMHGLKSDQNSSWRSVKWAQSGLLFCVNKIFSSLERELNWALTREKFFYDNVVYKNHHQDSGGNPSFVSNFDSLWGVSLVTTQTLFILTKAVLTNFSPNTNSALDRWRPYSGILQFKHNWFMASNWVICRRFTALILNCKS